MEKKNISVKDIAEMAGVSVATVSRVINQNGRFSKATEERVKKIIKEYNFQPNQLARGLRVSKAKVIGILVPDITNEFFANITLELQKLLLEEGYLALICNTNETSELELKQLDMMRGQQVSGVIYVAGNVENHDQLDLPVVYIDREPPASSRSARDSSIFIESDNRNGGYLAARELIEKGCRNIACVTYHQEISAHACRVQGYKDAIKEAGLKERILEVDQVNQNSGGMSLKQLLEENSNTDGVFFTADSLAIGGMQYLNRKGIHIPETVKLIGYDDTSICQNVWPPLTSIHQDVNQFGKLAVRAIIDLIDGESPGKVHYQIPVSLVRRGTT